MKILLLKDDPRFASRAAGIIVMAGEGCGEIEPEVRKHGIFFWMLKPFVSGELEIVSAHFSNRLLPT